MEILQDLSIERKVNSVALLQSELEAEAHTATFEYIKNQECLYFSELLEGQVRSEVSFCLVENRIRMAEVDFSFDWLELHKNGVDYAKQKAVNDVKLEPYIQIAEAEYEEAKLQADLISKNKPAMIITYSMCGKDVMDDESLRSIGRFPDLSRGYLRISVFDGNGKMTVISRTINNLSAYDISNVYAQEFGLVLDPRSSTIDILKNPIVLYEVDYGLADKLAPPAGVDTYKFVLQQQDIISAHLEGLIDISKIKSSKYDCANMSENLRYDIVSSLKHRLEGSWHYSSNLGSSIAQAGHKERSEGTLFYGCDTVLSASNESISAKLGYYSKGSEKLNCVKCPHCSKTVDLPKNLYDQGLLHCVECSSTFDKSKNRFLNKNELDQIFRRVDNKIINQQETFYQWWNRIGLEIKQIQKQKRQLQIEQNKRKEKLAAV